VHELNYRRERGKKNSLGIDHAALLTQLEDLAALHIELLRDLATSAASTSHSCVRPSGTRMFFVMILGTATLSWAMSRDMRSISTPTRLMLMERWFLGWSIRLIH